MSNQKVVMIGLGYIGLPTAALIHPDVDFVYPMHLNPNVRFAIKTIFGTTDINNSKFDNIFFIEPVEYIPFVYLLSKSFIVLTDSGGIQEEAPSIGIPVLVMRDTTERPEAVISGGVKLVGSNKETIIKNVSELIYNTNEYNKMAKSTSPYGDGNSSKIIYNVIDSLNNEK